DRASVPVLHRTRRYGGSELGTVYGGGPDLTSSSDQHCRVLAIDDNLSLARRIGGSAKRSLGQMWLIAVAMKTGCPPPRYGSRWTTGSAETAPQANGGQPDGMLHGIGRAQQGERLRYPGRVRARTIGPRGGEAYALHTTHDRR